MSNVKTKKELREQYKERKVIGGVYVIRNLLNNRLLLDSTVDIQGSRNRFEFAQKTGSCVDMKLQKDWAAQKASDFSFDVLEELEMSQTQTRSEFKADIEYLRKSWVEELAHEDLY